MGPATEVSRLLSFEGRAEPVRLGVGSGFREILEQVSYLLLTTEALQPETEPSAGRREAGGVFNGVCVKAELG